MTVYVTRTSKWGWYDFETFKTIESLLSFVKQEGDVILKRNFYYEMKDYKHLAKVFEMPLEDAIKLTECEFEIEIYDDYRE